MGQKIQHFIFPTKKNRQHPALFRYEAVAIILLVISVCELAVMFRVIHINDSGIFASVLPSVITDLTNTERSSNSRPVLVYSVVLAQAAQAKAEDMATHEYFAHTSPTGIEPWYWFQQAGYAYKYAGENLAIDFSDSDTVVTAWMNSPKHRENILKGAYTQIGIGVAQGMYEGHSTLYVVQFFGTPADAPLIAAAPIAVSTPVSVPVGAKETILIKTASQNTPNLQHIKPLSQKNSQIINQQHSPSAPTQMTSVETNILTVPYATRLSNKVSAPVGQILGAQSTSILGWIHSTFLTQILSSPIIYLNYMLYVMFGLLALIFMLGILPIHTEWMHRYALANGLSTLAVLAFCIFINTAYNMRVRVAGASTQKYPTYITHIVKAI